MILFNKKEKYNPSKHGEMHWLEMNMRIKKIVVTYKDKSRRYLFSLKKTFTKKSFKPDKWVVFEKGIIKNLYEKDLCKITFIYKSNKYI